MVARIDIRTVSILFGFIKYSCMLCGGGARYSVHLASVVADFIERNE